MGDKVLIKYKTFLFLVTFVILGWFLFTYKITDVPPGINGDEAAMGYNAVLVSRTGHDQNGRFLPLFVAIDSTDWKQPITFYSTVLGFKLFGASYFVLRAVSVVMLLLSGLIIFWLVKEGVGERVAFIGLLIFLTVPAVMIQSHLALENIAPIPFVSLWLLMLAKYHRTLKNHFLVLAGMFLGISLFSYPGMRLIAPVLFLASLFFIVYLGYPKKNRTKLYRSLASFILGFVPFPLIILAIRDLYPGAILAHNRPRIVSSYQDFFLPYLSYFDWSFLFLKGDATPYHSTGKQGVFLLAALPLFILGLVRVIQKKDPFLCFTALIFFLMPLLYGLTGTGSIYRSSRLLAFLPPFTLITALGLSALLNIKDWRWKISSLVIASLLIILNYLDFVVDYWYNYPLRVSNQFARPIHPIFEKSASIIEKNQFHPYVQRDLILENVTAFRFFAQIYFSQGVDSWQPGILLPSRSLLIADPKLVTEQEKEALQRFDIQPLPFSIFLKP